MPVSPIVLHKGAGSKPHEVSIEEKVRFLTTPEAYPHGPTQIAATETHMSWVFFAADRVYKLKKPVRYPFLDFTTLAARKTNCREEVRLNRRLAPNTYLGTIPLTQDDDGALSLGGHGTVIDWLVVMRRLPANGMLDVLIAQGRVTSTDLDRLAATLGRFYRGAEHPVMAPDAYADHFHNQQAENRRILTDHRFALDQRRIQALLERLEACLVAEGSLLRERAQERRIVDGHGDLRPEHICLTEPIAIFDCLEFSAALRSIDPFDELAFLGLECAMLGAAELGPALMARIASLLEGRPADALIRLYTALRAVMRARLSLAHLLDPVPRDPAKWEPLAARYMALADAALT